MTIEEYRASVSSWTDLVNPLLGESLSQDWKPWLNTDYDNICADDEEVVIFSLWSQSRRRGFSIQQPTSACQGAHSVKVLTRSAMQESGSPIEHLIVIAVPCGPHRQVITEIIRLWLLGATRSICAEMTIHVA